MTSKHHSLFSHDKFHSKMSFSPCTCVNSVLIANMFVICVNMLKQPLTIYVSLFECLIKNFKKHFLFFIILAK